MPPKQAARQLSTPVQDKENIDPATLSKKMQQWRDRRKVEKRNQLQARFDGDMAGSGRKIDELLEGAAEESASLRINFTTRLMELFKRRGDIEAQIIDHSRALEQAYTAANNELREVLKGKLEDIDEGLKGPKAAPPEAAHSS